MTNNSALQGKRFQEHFEGRWKALGKQAWLYRFEDAADLFGLNKGNLVLTTAKPADYVVGYKGLVALVEAKSTTDPKGFKTSMFRQSQRQALLKSRIAGTPHYAAIRNENTGIVYLTPGAYLHGYSGMVPWETLLPFVWEEASPPWTT